MTRFRRQIGGSDDVDRERVLLEIVTQSEIQFASFLRLLLVIVWNRLVLVLVDNSRFLLLMIGSGIASVQQRLRLVLVTETGVAWSWRSRMVLLLTSDASSTGARWAARSGPIGGAIRIFGRLNGTRRFFQTTRAGRRFESDDRLHIFWEKELFEW